MTHQGRTAKQIQYKKQLDKINFHGLIIELEIEAYRRLAASESSLGW
jgi:hypothetical protein